MQRTLRADFHSRSRRAMLVMGVAASAVGCFEDPPRIFGGPRIVGGQDAPVEQFPWQVSLQHLDHFCGGVVLDPRFVLTAAHCVEAAAPSLTIAAGASRLNDSSGQRKRVAKIFPFPGYTEPTQGKDIAMLMLESRLDLSDPKVARIAMVAPADVEAGITDPGVVATVSGWGRLVDGGLAGPDHLQAVQVPIISNASASEAYGFPLTSDQLSAGYLGEGGKDACQGDSGGPLVVPGTGEVSVLAGVVSWGASCADAYSPGVYARVSSFYAWIHLVMANGASCDGIVCGDGSCVAELAICDGVADCPDGTDEGAWCDAASCNVSQWSCGDGSCIPREHACDGIEDCYNGSDEDGHCLEPAGDGNCDPGEWACSNGGCINAAYTCDGVEDCSDASDEGVVCIEPVGDGDCASNQFVCLDGTCIPESFVCDGIEDCRHAADEAMDCPPVGGCLPEEFRCNNGACTLAEFECDGTKDCFDNSDEAHCDGGWICDPGTWTCLDGQCIAAYYECDGIVDCSDGSDEDAHCA